MPRGALPRPDAEPVLLRVAALSECAYEWAYHERIIARAAAGNPRLAEVHLPEILAARERTDGHADDHRDR